MGLLILPPKHPEAGFFFFLIDEKTKAESG